MNLSIPDSKSKTLSIKDKNHLNKVNVRPFNINDNCFEKELSGQNRVE